MLRPRAWPSLLKNCVAIKQIGTHNAIIGLVSVLFGRLYLFRRKIMPYHERAPEGSGGSPSLLPEYGFELPVHIPLDRPVEQLQGFPDPLLIALGHVLPLAFYSCRKMGVSLATTPRFYPLPNVSAPSGCGGSGRARRGFRPPRPLTRARRTALRAPHRSLTQLADCVPHSGTLSCLLGQQRSSPDVTLFFVLSCVVFVFPEL